MLDLLNYQFHMFIRRNERYYSMCNEKDIYLTIEIILFTCSIVTILSSLIIFCIYATYKAIRTESFKILICISISDITRSAIYMIPYSWLTNSTLCTFNAILGNSTITINVIWSIYIIYLLRQFYLYHPETPKIRFRTWFLVAFVGAPCFQLLPLLTSSYGINRGVCTYKSNTVGNIWRSVQEITALICVIIALIVYFKTFLKLNHLKILTWKEIVFEKGMIYCIIYIASLSIIFIYRITEASLNFCDTYILAYISYSVLSLQGFFNLIAIFSNQNFRLYLISFFLCKRISRSESLDYISLLK